MSGRNSKPKNDGPASSPERLDQFGDRLAEHTAPKPMDRNKQQESDC